MSIKELHLELKARKISESKYYLHGMFGSTNDSDKIALQIRQGKYSLEYYVYFKERGEINSGIVFHNEHEATNYILEKLINSSIIEKTNSLNFEGMTVNERLYATDLFNEFDNAKKENKKRAILILNLLKVDAESIRKILS